MRKAQSLANYGLLLVMVAVAFLVMKKYFQRGIQGKIAALSDTMIAPRSEHLAYTDETLESDATTVQETSQTYSFEGGGAKSKTATTTITHDSFTETTDPDEPLTGDD